MREYEITDVAAGHFHHPTFGDIDFDFPEVGPFTPRSEQDEVVLEQFMIPAGFATATGSPRQVSVGNLAGAGELLHEALHGGEGPTVHTIVSDSPYPEDGSVGDVVAWVAGDVERANYALDRELEREPHPRSGVTGALTKIVPDQES